MHGKKLLYPYLSESTLDVSLKTCVLTAVRSGRCSLPGLYCGSFVSATQQRIAETQPRRRVIAVDRHGAPQRGRRIGITPSIQKIFAERKMAHRRVREFSHQGAQLFFASVHAFPHASCPQRDSERRFFTPAGTVCCRRSPCATQEANSSTKASDPPTRANPNAKSKICPPAKEDDRQGETTRGDSRFYAIARARDGEGARQGCL